MNLATAGADAAWSFGAGRFRFPSPPKTQPSWEPTAREKLRPRGVISSLDMGAETS
nr:MAG TPA: hypothetical protein [Caudoviricetes sp.]DAT22796.1 MAG TPA: hypothetical protein [Caudoviricetes sp.]